MKNNSAGKFFLALLILGGVVLLFIFVVMPWWRENSPFRQRTEHRSIHEIYGLNPEVTQLVFGGRRLVAERSPLVEYRDGVPHVYLRSDFLRNFIDPFVFWDEGAGVLFVSTLYEMLEFSPGSQNVLLNGTPLPLENEIIMRSGVVYVPASVIHGLYPVLIEYAPEYNIVVISDVTQPQNIALVSADLADIHYAPGSRTVIARVPRGEHLVLFFEGDYGDEYEIAVPVANADDFVRVRTQAGLLGYVHINNIEGLHTVTSDLSYRQTILRGFVNNNTHPSRIWQGYGSVNLIWEYAGNRDANVFNMLTPLHPSLTVVSPTWFRIDETGTRLNSVASREYVDWAHSQGVEVWALVFDVNNAISRRFLMNREARQYAVQQLVNYAEILKLDGINIDFEHLLRADEGPYKIQFLRELAIPLREREVVLSASVKVPIPVTMFYRRDLIAKTVDFVVLMAYDQYWSTAPQDGHGHGPNASLNWVHRAVTNMLSDTPPEGAIPPERLILGLPFYNRIWREVFATGEVRHYRAPGTNTTREFFEERGVEWEWDSEIGSYFGQIAAFEDGEAVIFRVWLECGRSIQEKVNIFETYNLAGVASWNRALAIDEFWDVLAPHFGNE